MTQVALDEDAREERASREERALELGDDASYKKLILDLMDDDEFLNKMYFS